MKINTNILNNFFVCFDEASGFAIHKNQILKNKKAFGLSYVQNKSIIFILLLFISLILILLNEKLFVYSLIFFIISIAYFLVIIIRIYSSYKLKKNLGFNNLLLINEEGITDESFYGIKMTIKWDKVKGIVIGKYTITILTDTPIYFYLNISSKDKIINYCMNFISKDKIIY